MHKPPRVMAASNNSSDNGVGVGLVVAFVRLVGLGRFIRLVGAVALVGCI